MISIYAFPKKNRLLKSRDFQRVYRKGKWVANRELIINFEKHQDPNSRIGFTVSKKVSKRAVDRNRIKRQFREWYRTHKQDFFSIDIVMTAKPALNEKTAEEIQESLDDIWHKAQKKL